MLNGEKQSVIEQDCNLLSAFIIIIITNCDFSPSPWPPLSLGRKTDSNDSNDKATEARDSWCRAQKEDF